MSEEQPRKRARLDVEAVKSNAIPPSTSTPSNPTPSTSTRQISSVVYAGYEIHAQFSAPYPWEDLVKETATNGSLAEKVREKGTAVLGNSSRNGRDHHGRFGKKVQKASSRQDVRIKEDAKWETDGEDSLSSLSSSSEDEGEIRTGNGVKKEREASTDSRGSDELVASSLVGGSIASFSTFPPPPPSPPSPRPLPVSEPEPKESPNVKSDSEEHSTARTEDRSGEPSKPSQDAFQAVIANDPRNLSREGSPSAPIHSRPDLAPPVASTSTAILSESTSSSSIASPKRNKGGRFLPKPAGTTVKHQRALARQAAAAVAASQPAQPATLTQRQQRELNRKAREAREREERDRQALEGIGKEEERRLWVCERCFKYMAELQGWKAHQKDCKVVQPPGRRVYQRGATSIWEVDGATAKLYCQNLCLFAKLFIEHKYMFFDVEGFSFYLLTETMSKQEWVLGYFSKEKVSYDDYNLACIVVFPPFRQKGWATLLIEFSYEISRRLSPSPGTPERPLSALGQSGYLSHWTSVLVRYFRSIFTNHSEPPYIEDVIAQAQATEVEMLDVEEGNQSPPSRRHRKIKRAKGWDGELPSGAGVALLGQYEAFTLRPGGEGEVSGRVDEAGEFDFGPSELQVLAEKVNLQVEDVAWAMVESGLAQWRSGGIVDGDGPDSLIVTPELVEAVAEKKKVRRIPMLDVAYVLL